jgi:hypothetical protein
VQAAMAVLGRADWRDRSVELQLNDTDLRRAYLPRADLQHAYLPGVNLEGARLAGADFTGAKADASTTWPPGFDPVTAGVALDQAIDDPQREREPKARLVQRLVHAEHRNLGHDRRRPPNATTALPSRSKHSCRRWAPTEV